jgi:hypothetical protein
VAVGALDTAQCIANVTLAAPAFPGTAELTVAAVFDPPLPEQPPKTASAATMTMLCAFTRVVVASIGDLV